MEENVRPKKLKIALTGASGLLGNALFRSLKAAGHELSILLRPGSEPAFDTSSVRIVRGDLSDIFALQTLFEGADCVVHAAGLVSWRNKDRDDLFRTNTAGTGDAVNMCLKVGVPRFCFISSSSALGEAGPDGKVNEKSARTEESASSAYAASKYLAENEVWRGAAEGLSVLVLNPSVVLGQGPAGRSSARLLEYGLKNPRFFPEGKLNFVSAVDLAEIVGRLLLLETGNERFIINGGQIEYARFFEQIARKAGFSLRGKQLSAGTMRLVARLLHWPARLNLLPGEFSPELIEAALDSPVYDTSKIRNLLNFDFQSAEQILDELLSSSEKK